MADTDPAELERRIERTRAELARTVDAIADRVSPGNVARRTVARAESNAREFVVSLGERISGAVGVAPRPVKPEGEPDDLWAGERPGLAPVLVGVGAVLVVGAVVVLWRRRRG
ncbi:DUF3618 domain-containing protein [Planomonospora venezuelensis]|uniref:DUF3618 domain-containing protein n=1 Tax=Planomonospora venezuelensis TaxID=1999 RepID=A0A841DBP5_PLAVE|nr:DUF3618 domain-containing protein [Planomonospora venezuelensis]MBB5965874.1 hypothetical protein [Planomonospora venezuelensis]GIN04068.1 hypothetical protein Pve01_57260 [Planomonospora venezuelensis]